MSVMTLIRSYLANLDHQEVRKSSGSKLDFDGGDDRDGDRRKSSGSKLEAGGDEHRGDDGDRRSMTMLFISRSALAFPSPAVPVLAIVTVYTAFYGGLAMSECEK